MGLIDKAGKKVLLKLPDLKLISLARESMPYISVQADGLSFFFKNTDHSILDYMVENKTIWSKDEMDFILGFYESISTRPGTVIDIGANVGTSIIYFRKKFGEGCAYYAVEPVTDNYNLLRANCDVNGFSDIKSFRYGISETEGEARMEINPENMATCKIENTDNECLVYRKDEDAYIGDTVTLRTVDSFALENGIDMNAPILFWIDVEGHEPEVIKSAKKTFKSSDCAVYCEFNPRLYKHNGKYDGFISDVRECFSRFICFGQAGQGDYQFRNIDEIINVAEENGMKQCDLFMVK